MNLDLSDLWTPLPTQQRFLDAIHAAPSMGLVAYVGSFGSGKTWSICRATLGLALRYPGMRILLGRFYSTDLQDTTMEEWFTLLSQLEAQLQEKYTNIDLESVLGTFKAAKKDYHFNNGSLVMFRPLEQAEQKYRSLKIAAFGIDEASEVPESSALMLHGRIRQVGQTAGEDFPRVGYIVSNPTPTTHWLYKWFVAKPKPNSVLLRTNTLENAHNLPEGYIETLRASYSPDWVRVFLEGQWGEMLKGRRPVFPTFDQLVHVRETKYYPDLPIYIGVDFGYQSPGVVWCQLDPDNRLLIHRSWHPNEINAYDLADGVRKRTEAWFPYARPFVFAGVDGNTKKDTGEKTSAEIFRAAGMNITVKYSHIDRGLMIVRNLLDKRDDDNAGVWVNPFNQRVIEGFQGGYYYPPVTQTDLDHVKEIPAKDGMHDPLFDALRYIVVNILSTAGVVPSLGSISPFGMKTKKLTPLVRKLQSNRRRVISYGGT